MMDYPSVIYAEKQRSIICLPVYYMPHDDSSMISNGRQARMSDSGTSLGYLHPPKANPPFQ